MTWLSRFTARWAISGVILLSASAGAQTIPSVQHLRVKRNLVYGVVDGEPLRLDAYMPGRSIGPRPGVIFIHGGGWRKGDKRSFDLFSHLIAQTLGWPAFSINYRLHVLPSGYPAEFHDVERAVRWIRAHASEFEVDASRLGVVGGSAGANLATELATRSQAPFNRGASVRAAVSWSGPMDLTVVRHFRVASPSVLRRIGCAFGASRNCMLHHVVPPVLLDYFGCTPRQCLSLYRRASPITYAHRQEAALLMINSRQETVPLSQLREMARRLRQLGAPYQVLIFPGRRHARAYWRRAWRPTVQFLQRYLNLSDK